MADDWGSWAKNVHGSLDSKPMTWLYLKVHRYNNSLSAVIGDELCKANPSSIYIGYRPVAN